MSRIGNNIKKIRGVKGFSQSRFAELFDIKRASVGAYEEGRAEPKIATIIEIAKYFGISIDELLNKELSVNDLYRFDNLRKDLVKDGKHNLKSSLAAPKLCDVPYISQNQKQDYFSAKHELELFPQLRLALPELPEMRAFEVGDMAMFRAMLGPQPADIVVTTEALAPQAELERGKMYLFELHRGEWLLRRFSANENSKLTLSADNPNFYNEEVAQEEIRTIRKIALLITKNFSGGGLV